MLLKDLHISNFKNLRSTSIEVEPGINVVLGENGSGKTSILEAIYFSARAKSFVVHEQRKLISYGKSSLEISAAYRGELDLNITASSTGKLRTISINGSKISSLSTLSQYIVVRPFYFQMMDLVGNGPDVRRGVMDWGLFHVEHVYAELRKRFESCRSNLNACLKIKDLRQMDMWIDQYVELSQEISRNRKNYIETLAENVRQFSQNFKFLDKLQITYRKGWSSESNLKNELKANIGSYLKRGFVSVGPHRDDFLLELPSGCCRDVLSRGQRKMLVLCIELAAEQITRTRRGAKGIFLVDDYGAELDGTNRQILLQMLMESGSQCFVTTAIDQLSAKDKSLVSTMFHVEHGSLKKM